MNFLVDVNLPKYFSFFRDDIFIHVVDINPSMTDTVIWDYALTNNLVILTKDSDFFARAIMAKKCPKIVYFQLGNKTLNELHLYFEKFWEEITKRLQESSLIVAKPEMITIIL